MFYIRRTLYKQRVQDRYKEYTSNVGARPRQGKNRGSSVSTVEVSSQGATPATSWSRHWLLFRCRREIGLRGHQDEAERCPRHRAGSCSLWSTCFLVPTKRTQMRGSFSSCSSSNLPLALLPAHLGGHRWSSATRYAADVFFLQGSTPTYFVALVRLLFFSPSREKSE